MASTSKHAQLVTSMKEAEKKAQSEESLFLVELVTAATLDEKPEYTLSEVSQALRESQAWNLLDPLNLLPLLISSDNDAAPELIQKLSEDGNAKEALIAVQEALERLETAANSEAQDEETANQNHATEVVRLLGVCENAIPRIKLRKKGPGETIRSVLMHVGAAINTVAPLASKEDGRNIISSVSRLVKVTSPWVAQNADAEGSEHNSANEILHDLLQVTLSACVAHIHADLAQRRFEAFSPRLVFRSSVAPESARGVEVVDEALDATRLLAFTPERLASSPPSLGQLILLAHGPPASFPSSPSFLQKLLPILTSSLQQNIAMDQSLALLLTFVSSSPESVLSEEIVDPIAALLTPLASTHPHPPTRHVTFRILALFLSRAAPSVHVAHLSSLLTDCPYPQMRVAAVGLVKEAFLKAVSSNEQSPFTSPTLVRAFGPALFRPNPADLFSSLTDESLKKFLQSSEPARLTECLAFYYVLLKRDTKNLSGIRDRDVLRTVENGLLAPLRRALAVWLHDSSADADPHALMPLASLETSIERVDGAVASLS